MKATLLSFAVCVAQASNGHSTGMKTHTLALDLTERFPQLIRKTTVRLHPRQAKVADKMASKMGGLIAWPRDEPWPRCPEDQSPMVPIVQLRKQDVPELGFPQNKDLFQMLWCPRDDHSAEAQYDPIPHFCWRDCRTIGNFWEEPPAPVNPETDLCPKECKVHPERVGELPALWALPSGMVENLEQYIGETGSEDLQRFGLDAEGSYAAAFGSAPGSKVGGYPLWIQDPEELQCSKCGNDMQHLLTISSSEVHGCVRWVPEGESMDSVKNSDTGLTLGDMGSMYVFCCQRCDDKPLKSFVQMC